MSRKKRPNRSQKRGLGERKRLTPPSVTSHGWSRAGAHNIAGVSFQVAVTTRLLLDARAGNLPIVRVTPEGLEDIDLDCHDDARMIVQVKERSPTARFVRSDLVSALSKKSVALEEDPRLQFILATDAKLGAGLSSTGWDKPLSDCLSRKDLDGLEAQLKAYFNEPCEVLNRTHVVQIERSVTESSRQELARVMGIHPSVATLAYARLVELVTKIAVRQRSATPDTVEWIVPSDLDTLTTRVLETVDINSLDEAVRTGIIEPVDFGVATDLSVNHFLGGVDVLPIHIAADLDIPRPAELDALANALRDSNSTLLTAPSGAGKSALMWRTTKELAGHVRPYRLLRLLPEDISTVSRWIRLQEPSENFPLLLCADNLGRPQSEGWTALAREFIDRPGILLLGACREEDFRPELVIGRTTLVVPKLDIELAASIGDALADRQVQTVVDVAEAFEASEGLLMEFLSMLLTGRRLRQVVEQQMAERLTDERKTERDIIRYITTAHSAGVSLPAEVLGDLMPDRDLAPALSVLKQEHIVDADNASQWRGLHELRSSIARDYLHLFPPPTIGNTIRQLVEYLPITDTCRIIEFYAQQAANLEPATDAVTDILTSPDVSASDAAQLVSSLAMADAFRHSRECLSVIEERRPRGLDPETALSLAYAHRFTQVSFESLKEASPNFSYLIEIASHLPPRPKSLRDSCLRKLSSDAVRDIALRGTPEQAVSWLESLEDSPVALDIPTQELMKHFCDSNLRVVASLIAALTLLDPDEGGKHTVDIFGDLQDRINWVVIELADCVSAEVNDESDGIVVTMRLLVPEDDATTHDRSVEVCRLLLDLCPEADICEAIVLTPDGDRYCYANVELGYKRIPRENLPRPPLTTVNRNFMRAGRLLLASRYWTDHLRLLADISRQLFQLRDDAVAWLINPHHNVSRRRKAVTLANSLVSQLAAGPKEPEPDDGTEDRSGANKALTDALLVVRDIAASKMPDDLERRRLGARCRSAAKGLSDAKQGNLPRLSTVGDPLPESLVKMLILLGDVLLSQAEHLMRKPRRIGTESWVDAADRFVAASRKSGYQDEKVALEEALGGSTRDCEIRRIRHQNLKSPRLLTDWWAFLVQAEGSDSDLLEFAKRLDQAMAEQLAFRVFVVFVAAENILPLYALSLGLSECGPATDEDLCAIAFALGNEVLKSAHLEALDALLANLVRASREATLLQMRRKAGLIADAKAFDAQYESARRAAEELHPLLKSETNRLLSYVEREPEGRERTLAGEIYRSITHDEQSDALVAIATLRIAALSIDL